MKNRQNELERIAGIFYERSGNAAGNDLDNWLKAERYLSVWYGKKRKGFKPPAFERRKNSLMGRREQRGNAASHQL